MLHAARALADPAPATDGRLLHSPLAPRVDDPGALADLVAFVEHPVKAFLRQRLGIRISELPEAPSDELDLHPGGLAKYQIGQRITDALLTGTTIADALAAEAARGQLPPPGALRDRVLDDVAACAQAIVSRARDKLGIPYRTPCSMLSGPIGRTSCGATVRGAPSGTDSCGRLRAW